MVAPPLATVKPPVMLAPPVVAIRLAPLQAPVAAKPPVMFTPVVVTKKAVGDAIIDAGPLMVAPPPF